MNKIFYSPNIAPFSSENNRKIKINANFRPSAGSVQKKIRRCQSSDFFLYFTCVLIFSQSTALHKRLRLF